MNRVAHTLTGTSAVGANSVFGVIGTTPTTLATTRSLTFVAVLKGNTGGTLDAFIQVTPDGFTWFDWCHFPQLAAGAAEIIYTGAALRPAALATLTTIGKNQAPLLAANTSLGTDWGIAARLVTVSVNATAGAEQTLIVTAYD